MKIEYWKTQQHRNILRLWLNLLLKTKQETIKISTNEAYSIICMINDQRKVNLTKYGKILSFQDFGPYNLKLSNTACFQLWSWMGHHQVYMVIHWIALCPNCHRFTPLTTQKIKILKKWNNKNKHLEILAFYKCVP